MTVRQTACRHCGQDIEGWWPYRTGEWRDRGHNTHCPNAAGDAGQLHGPVTMEPIIYEDLAYRTRAEKNRANRDEHHARNQWRD